MQLNRKWMYAAIAPMIFVGIPGAAVLIGGSDSTAAVTDSRQTLRLVADLSDGRLRMYESDTLVWQYPISVGKNGFQTPTGSYTIRKMVWNPGWVPPKTEWAKKYTPKKPGEPGNPMKVVKIFFKEPTYYIHGTSEIAGLGAPASHGCIRMDPEHVAEVARFIMTYGGQPRSDNWFMRVLRFRSEEKPIYLTKSVPLLVRR